MVLQTAFTDKKFRNYEVYLFMISGVVHAERLPALWHKNAVLYQILFELLGEKRYIDYITKEEDACTKNIPPLYNYVSVRIQHL